MSGEKRRYTKKVRAELEEDTRRRITESAVELHGTVGPARTSFSAVAERAGVRRSTLYRHFPDEEALFAACSAHWAERNPPPDPSGWSAIQDPDARVQRVLGEIYAYYRRTAPMIGNLLRDEATVKAIREPFRAFHDYLAGARDALLAGRGLRGHRRRRAVAAAGHALAFTTWQSLTVEQGLTDAEAAQLMTDLVASAG